MSSHMNMSHSAPPARTGPVPYVPRGKNDVPHVDAGKGPTRGGAATHLGHRFGAPGFNGSSNDRPKYNPQQFPRAINANRHFGWKGGNPWHDQPGFYYRRWSYGQYLPAGWFAADFWINDFADYDLPVPPYGYEWVRSGPDALLVDTYSGEVVESVYGVF
jgi:Ni/Co efflux regulator RcnB